MSINAMLILWQGGPAGTLFRLIPLVVILAVALLLISMAMNMTSSGGSVSSSRREFIQGVTAIGVVTFLVAVLAPISSREIDKTAILSIAIGETYTVQSDRQEEYVGVNIAESGTLAFDTGGTLTITESEG